MSRPAPRSIAIATAGALVAISTTSWLLGARGHDGRIGGSLVLLAVALLFGAMVLASAAVRFVHPDRPMTITARDGQKQPRTLSRRWVLAMFALGAAFYIAGTCGSIALARL